MEKIALVVFAFCVFTGVAVMRSVVERSRDVVVYCTEEFCAVERGDFQAIVDYIDSLERKCPGGVVPL